jgi:hypothetical protein
MAAFFNYNQNGGKTMNRFEVIGTKDSQVNVLLISTNDERVVKRALEMAKEKGFTNIQVSDLHNLEKPDFIGTLAKEAKQ